MATAVSFKRGDIKRQREALKLTVRELADLAGVAPNTILAAERGEGVSLRSWRRILLGLSQAGKPQ